MGVFLFQDNFSTVKTATDEAIARAAEIIGGMWESNAKEEINKAVYDTPETWYVRTGNLRNSIDHYVENGKTVVVGSTSEYAPHVELGTGIYAGKESKAKKIPWSYQDAEGNWHSTSGMAPRPYIRPGFENHRDEYKEVFKEEIKKKMG